MQKVKSIDDTVNKSFFELDWKPNEWLALDNRDIDMPQPLMLMVPTDIKEGHKNGGLKVTYIPSECSSCPEKWQKLTIYSDLYLSLDSDKIESFNFSDNAVNKFERAYIAERAISGKENVIDYFRKNNSFKKYISILAAE